MNALTLEQQATNASTSEHIRTVQRFIHLIANELLSRAILHDQSKLASPEVEAFTEYTPKLAASTYGSKEYDQFLKELGPALAHHYAKNRHHPEHFPEGISGMNLVDLVEMFCDWKAATMRHDDGNLLKSIEHNAKRFDISPQLAGVLRNTAELFD